MLCGHAESVVQDRCGLAGRGDNDSRCAGDTGLSRAAVDSVNPRAKLSTGQHFPIRKKSAEQAF